METALDDRPDPIATRSLTAYFQHHTGGACCRPYTYLYGIAISGSGYRKNGVYLIRMGDDNKWLKTSPREFWGELAPCEHVLQIYETEESFISTLAGFVCDGISSGDCTMVIATRQHIGALKEALSNQGLNVNALIGEGLFRPLDAKAALSNFMQANWPDAEKFHYYISGLFREAKEKGRKVRAFGEMVAVLWAEGNSGATVQLEHLWNEFCSNMELTLFCAYPKSGFTDAPESSLQQICSAHARIISGEQVSENMLSYKP